MIYEYPEEFIVPIVYVNELEDKGIYRDKKTKYVHGNSKLLITDKEFQDDEIFIADIDIYGVFKNKDINSFNVEGEYSKKFFKEPMMKTDMIKGALKDEYIKSMLSDIDEEYAISETLRM